MDEMIDAALITHLAGALRRVGARPAAVEACRVGDEKLRRRVDLVRDALLVDLPPAYGGTASVVRAAFADETFTGWMLWPVSEAVVDRALGSGSAKDFDDALDVLALLTTRLTGEFAMRAMLGARLDRTLEVAEEWTRSPDLHVRRLASEGTRSHLPWARGVPELVRRPGVTRAIVDALHTDESEYVRRSVANHVNDLSRDAPDLAADIVADWLDRPDENTPRVARHALRTLVKKGHPRDLALMGFEGAEFHVDGPTVTEHRIPLGAARDRTPGQRATSRPRHLPPRGAGGVPVSTTEQVLAIVESVPPGRVTTYGSIADVVEGASARSVGHALRTDGHGVAWWRVVSAGGRPAPGAEAAAHERFLAEGTPLVRADDGTWTVDLAAAIWHVEADGPR